jgi:sigma-B regulation protein RsbU (phosphoserine phosphatase)
LLLAENSSTVQVLVRSHQPVPLYRDNPDEWFIEADTSEKRALDQLHTELLLGLPGRKQLMGLIALGSKRSEEPYTPSDLRLLQTVATQTGLALEVSELAESLAKEASQRARINREIEIAREVQQRLFPQRMPVVPGASLAGACRPAQGVGGDYYDAFELPDGRLGLAIGDVSGKGISAALLMASLRACLRTMTVVASMDLAKLMERMNQLVYESSAVNRYATFFFSVYDPATRVLCYVNAGHNPPALSRSSTDSPVIRLEAGGPVVGLLPHMQYEEQSVTLQAGDLLLTYTDGISEAMTEDDEEWGEERMLQTVKASQGRSVEEILRAMFQAADQFTAGAEQHDDMTLLLMKIE